MKTKILSIITALALVLTLFPARAAAVGQTRKAGNSEEFHSALSAAQDGDTIELTASFVLKNPVSNNDSLVIDKKVTIDGRGHSMTLWYAGILLGADVEFKNITLGLGSNVRPAIMANGHTLTLDSVKRDPTARHIQLFCGGQTGATQGDKSASIQGEHGQIILKGSTDLGEGNIYAGSISTDGKPNKFTKPATITFDKTFQGRPVENIYSSGALETPTSENDWFDYENEIAAPTASTTDFPVSEAVTINLYDTGAKKVDGATGTANNNAQITYKGDNYLNDNLTLTNIASLKVESGNLAPAEINSLSASTPIEITSGATLGLQKQPAVVTVGDFTGGGNLVLGESQKLTVTGTVSGSTTVGIGNIFNGHSLTVPHTDGHVYIDATGSAEGNFTLAAPGSRPDIKLVRGEDGGWKAEEGHKSNVPIVDDFAITSVIFDPNEEENVDWFAKLPFKYVKYALNSAESPIAFIPLTIKVNGIDTSRLDDDSNYTYTTGNLSLAIAGDTGGEELQIETVSSDVNQTVPLTGPYTIEVTVPAANSGTGQPITRTATLVVKAAGGGDTAIPVPQANKGLVYNGQEQTGVPVGGAYVLESGKSSATDAGEYKATITPKSGFTWESGSKEPIIITWHIAPADNENLPTRLTGEAPTIYNGDDGKITGTSAEMEYADNKDFTQAQTCDEDETTGLIAGTYYVRYKGDKNHNPGDHVQVTVPNGPITVTGIAISSTGHKTEYKVGEDLDVSGLTLKATYSNGTEKEVPVDTGMVSGFDTSAAIASQTLTIKYYGGTTTTYVISIAEAEEGGGDNPPTTPPTTEPPVTETPPATETPTPTSKPTSRPTSGPIVPTNRPTTAPTAPPVAGGSTTTAIPPAAVEDGTAASEIGSELGSAIADEAEKHQSESVVIAPEIEGEVSRTQVSIPAKTLDELGSRTEASLTVSTPIAAATIPNEALSELAQGGGAVTVTAERRGGGIELTVTAGGNKVERVPGGIKAEIPANGASAGTVAVLVQEDGTRKVIRKSAQGEGSIVAPLDGSGRIEIIDNSKPYSDVSKDSWASEAIDYASARELFSGTGKEQFSPNKPMSRGMLAVVLHNLEDNPEQEITDIFTDVSAGKWYTKGIAWAAENGIITGYGSSRFGPEEDVTREQMAVMLWRYAGSPKAEGELDFADKDKTSPWAVQAMRWAAEKGIINGKGGGILDPTGKATRAQAAQMLKNFLESRQG